MTRLEQLSRELVDVVVNLGYPAELGELMAQNLGTESTVEPDPRPAPYGRRNGGRNAGHL